MHRGRNTTIGVNPIPPKQHCVRTLAVDDEEQGWDGPAANCQLHIEDALRLGRLAVEIIEHYVGLDKISSRTTQSAQHRVRHQIDCGASVDQHPVHRLAIDEALEIQSLQVLVAFLLGLLEDDRLWAEM